MSGQQDKGGRTLGGDTVRRQLARTLNPRAQQLSEAVLAKALMGDSTAQLAAVEMLKMANQPRSKQPGTRTKGSSETSAP
jgi:hypothetical protein